MEPSSSRLKNNKRKLSGSTDDMKIIKTIRRNDLSQFGEKKENVCSPAVSGECSKSFGTASETLPNLYAEDIVKAHAKNSAEASEICETVIDLDGNESGHVSREVSVNEVDKKLRSDASKGKVSTISSKVSAISDAGPDVIVLSDSEDSGKENLIVDSYRVIPADEQNTFCKNETTDGKQAVSDVPPVVDSEQSETENRPVVVNDCLCESVKSEKERSPLGSDSVVEMQVSPKSSPQCSRFEINSGKNATDTAASPECLLQNSLSDESLNEHTPQSETSICCNLDSAQKIKKLTPKQLLKQLESERKKKEKERQRQVTYLKFELLMVPLVFPLLNLTV